MSAPRFYLPPEDCRGPKPTLAGREAHHATRVLRLRVGDALTLLDGEGKVISCEIARLDRQEVELAVKETTLTSAPRYQIALLQALTKAKSFEWLLQKATELGVARVVPVLTDRTVPEIAPARAANKREKWHWLTVDALKQCGSAWLPQLAEPSSLADILREGREQSELKLVAAFTAEARHPRECFDRFCALHRRQPVSVAIWVGPEGDFTPKELSALLGAGVVPITLGPQVLRAETAALYCLAVVQAELTWPRL